jgi:hypothetical protein
VCSCVTENTPISFSAPTPASLSDINLKLDILCYSSVDFPVAAAVSELIIPGLVDQMSIMKKIIAAEITQQPQVRVLIHLIGAFAEVAFVHAALVTIYCQGQWGGFCGVGEVYDGIVFMYRWTGL